IHAEQGQRAAQKRQVLGEIHHLMHTLLRILHAPEVVHHGRYASQEDSNGSSAQLWFYSQQNACAACDERGTGGGDGYISQRNVFRLGISCKRFPFLEMVDAVVQKEAAEHQTPDEKR